MNKKTIIIAVIIFALISIVSLPSILKYLWITDLEKEINHTQSIEEEVEIGKKILESILIESMWNNNGKISFAVKNIGQTTIDLKKLFIYANYLKEDIDPNQPELINPLAPNEARTINTKIPFPKVGEILKLKLVTQKGVVSEYNCHVVENKDIC